VNCKQRIALIRELPFKREVSLANESPQATSEGILSDEYGTQSLVHISRAYKRLGLLPESADFAAAPADYVRLERTFYYEARKDLIVITPCDHTFEVLRQTRKSVAHPPFRFGTANERKRGRRSNIR
jgi:hypothetical protein